jgi:hypothetical protein
MTIAGYIGALMGKQVRVIDGDEKRGEIGTIEYMSISWQRVVFDDGENHWIRNQDLELLPEQDNNPLPLPG